MSNTQCIFTKEELQNHRSLTKEFIKQYTVLKVIQEKELKEFKNSLKLEIDDLIQDIQENGISKQNLDNHRVAFEKLLYTCDFGNPNQKPYTSNEISEIIFNRLILSMRESNSRNRFSYEERYINSRDKIILYYQKHFEMKSSLDEFKSKQHNILKILTTEIYNNGIPLFIVRYVYKRIKIENHTYNISPGEFNYCQEIYEELKEDLFKLIKN